MSRYTSLQKKERKDILQKAVLAMLATGMIAWPSFSPVYAASDYTRLDNGTNVTNGNVTDIYVGKQNGAVGVNVFSKFNVASGDIANMQFHNQAKTYTATHLLNFVQDRINVSGTVNAIRNNRIGGNLYFISSNGMIVNEGGAINAGALTVMAPQYSYISKAFTALEDGATNTATEILKGMIKGDIPLNPSGSIVINGTVRTGVESRFMAANIVVGKDLEVDGEGAAQFNADGTLKVSGDHNARIVNGVNFSSIVNTAGLEGCKYELPADFDTDTTGQYRLNLQKEVVDGDDVYYLLDAPQGIRSDGTVTLQANLGVEKTSIETVTGSASIKTNIEIGKDAVIDSVGSVNIAATSDASPSGVDFSLTLAFLDAIANVNVDGTITAGHNVDINANATSTSMHFGPGDFTTGIITKILTSGFDAFNPAYYAGYAFSAFKENLTPFLMGNAITFIKATAKADVKVGATANVTAKDDVNVQGMSTAVAMGMRSVTPNKTYDVLGGQQPYENINFVMANLDSVCNVDIEGNLTAEEGTVQAMAISAANATTLPTIAANEHNVGASYSGYANVGIGIDLVKNKANLTIGENAKIDAGAAAVLGSMTDTGASNCLELETDQRAAFNTGVGYVQMDANANTDIKGSVTSAGVVNIMANATVSGNENKVDNASKLAEVLAYGTKEWKLPPDQFEVLMPEENKINVLFLQELFKFMGQIGKNGEAGAAGGGGDAPAETNIFEKFDFGASIGITKVNNNSKVEVGKNAKIYSLGPDVRSKEDANDITSALTIAANSSVAPITVKTKANMTDTAKEEGTAVSAAVSVSVEDIVNNADVVVDARDSKTTAQTISGGEPIYLPAADIYAPMGTVTINATTLVGGYGPINWYNKLKDIFVGNPDKDIKSFPEVLKDFFLGIGDKFTTSKKVTAEFEKVFGITADGGQNLVKDENYDGSLYMDDVLQKLQQVEENTNGGLSQMLLEFKNDYQDTFNSVYDVANSEQKFIDHDSRDFTNDGVAGQGGTTVDLVFKAPVQHDVMGLVTTLIDLLIEVPKAMDPAGMACNIAATAQSGSNADPNHNSLSFSGAAAYFRSNNSANVVIGRNVQIEGGRVDIGANEKQIAINILTGKQSVKILKLPTPYDVSGMFAIGGNVAINNISNDAVVLVAEGAEIRTKNTTGDPDAATYHDAMLLNSYQMEADKAAGKDTDDILEYMSLIKNSGNVDVNSISDDVNIAAVLGGGKAMKLGLTGMAAVLKGHNYSYVGIDDEAKLNAEKTITIQGINKSVLASAVMDLTKASGVGIGASAGVLDFDIDNLVMVADNDILSVTPNGSTYTITLPSDANNPRKDREAEDFIKKLNQVLGGQYAQAGRIDTNLTGGEIEGDSLTLDAKTSGFRLNITLAGTETDARWENVEPSAVPEIGVAGSVSVNDFVSRTDAILETPKVTLHAPTATIDSGHLKINAADSGFVGAISGAAAVAFHITQSEDPNPGARLAGAVALNNITRDTVTEVFGTNIVNAVEIENYADSSGTQVAAGLSAGLSIEEKSSSEIDATASVSKNTVVSETKAILKKATTQNALNAVVNNIATAKDIQVAGGINLNAAGNDFACFGVATAFNTITNTIEARIEEGTYDVKTLNNYANSQLKQVAGAVAVGLQLKEAGKFTGQGAGATNTISNTVKSISQDANITADKVDMLAWDGVLTLLPDQENIYIKYLQDRGFDINGDWALDLANSTAGDMDMDVKDDPSGDPEKPSTVTYKTNKFTDGGKKGNTMVSFAAVAPFDVAGEDKKVKALGSVVKNTLTNVFDTTISGGTITAKASDGSNALSAQAKADSRLVAVAAGVAAGTGTSAPLQAAGSVVLNNITDTVGALVQNSTIKSDKTYIYANDLTNVIGVAGALGVYKSGENSIASGGLTWAQGTLNNLTSAKMLGTNLDEYNSGKKADLTLNAANDFTIHSIAAEVNANFQFNPDLGEIIVLRGAYAFNQGTNSIEALVDKTTDKASVIANGGNITVATNDTATEQAIAVAVGLDSSKMSGGVHIAKSYIGEEAADKHQHNFAKIQNTTITLAGADSALKVEALDNSKLTTIAVGGGLDKSALFGLNGSVAKAQNYKDVIAALDTNTISVNSNLTAKEISVHANNTMAMTTSADGASVGNKSLVIGAAGVATNDSVMTTKAYINGNNTDAFKTDSVDVSALSDNTLTNVGISLTGDISNGLDDSKPLNLDVLANVAKNKLKNDTIALVENFKVDADKTVTVKAKSEEKITNVVGAANIMENTGSDTALNFAFGASVAVNTITGSTLADLLNSNINVGNGLYVNADAFHKNKNVVFSGGLIVSQSKDVNVTLSANAIVSDNEISGETKARLYKTDVNKDGSASQAAVEVTAKDDIKLDSTTANAQMQVTIGDSNINILLGAGVLYEDNNRSVKALAAGENGSNKSTVNAKTFKVDANSTQTDNVVNACVGVSIAIPSAEAIAKMFTGKPPVNGSGAASVATTHVDLKGITLAQVDYVNTDNQGLTVNAFHKDTVNATGVGAAGTFGLFGLTVGVSVYKFTDDSKTISLLQNSTVTHKNGTVADDEIIAKNESKLTSDVYAIAAGLNVGIAGAVAVWENNFNSSTLAKVADTNIGTVSKRAGNLKVLADTDVTEGFASVAGGISAVGIGANRVRNTLNTTTNAEVTGSGSDSNKIYVNSAEVKAQENRKVTDSILQVPIGALEIGVSDIVTNIGFVGTGDYTVTYSDKVVEDTVNSSNENLGENNSINLTDGNINAAKSAENQSRGILRNSINNTKLKDNNIYGGWSDVGELDGLTQEDISTLVTFTSGVHSKVTGVTLDSTGSADISTNINNNISSTSKNYPMLAGVGVNVIKNLVTLHQDNSVDIDKVKIRAGNTFIGNVTGGEIKVHAEDARLLQGLTIMVVKSSATRNGGTEINVQDSDLIGLNNQNFRNLDTLKLNAEVVSAGNSVLAGSYLEAETKDTGTMALNIGVSATDKSSSLYSNGNITFENLLAPQLNSGVYYGGGKIASGQGTLASAWLGNENETSTDKTISLDVSDTSIFANNVQVTNGLSDNNGQQAKLTVDEEVTSVSVLEIAVNKGRTTSIVNVGTNFNNIKSNAALANAYRTANNIEGTVGVADWHVFANSTLDISNNLKNADVGIGICTGTNYTRNYTKNTTALEFTVADGTNFEAKTLEIKANSVANGTVHTHANDGGIIEISPVAAGVKNEMTFDTSVSIGGNFVVTGKADIQSQHSSDLYLFADGHCGSTVGGSGVMVNNKVVVNNSTNLNAANITTGDTLTVKTNTFFDLNKNFNVEEGTPDDFMLYSSNKGGLANGCGSYLTSDITITDKTNITNSTLQSQGNLVIGSYGDHHIYVTQSGVSSSAIGGGNNSVVSNTINKTDEVNINQDSGKTTELLTLDKNADIYLVATDITDASAKCFSEHTFSIVFAGAGAHLTDNITRNNKINVNGGTIFSYKGVNLFTNLDEKNVLGKMLLQESSRTFTSGAITIPYSNITSTLKQNNQVIVGGGAEVYSIGDVNIYADKGTETINRKSGSYCWYKNNQKEEFVSTSNGGTSSSVTRNNFVDVKGTVTAGVLNNFEIYIGKEGQDPILIVPDNATKTTYFDGAGNSFGIYTAGQYEQYISFGFVDDASGTVAEKEAALYRLTGINKAALKPELVDMATDTDKRLNEIQRLLGEYSSDGTESDAYRALKKEEQLLIDQMARRGLAGGTIDGAQRISENMRVKVPDIIASGGNVHIETDTLKGNGKITANGMQEVKITNNTSTLLEVHNISVVNPGGQITFNGKVLDKTNYKNEIKGLNVDKSVGDSNIPTLVTQASGTPTITISGLWSGANVKYKEFTDGGETVPAGSLILPADIYILGTVENLTGNVYIKSLANDIVVNSSKDSGIRGANITLQAEQGGIVQMAPESTINIGQSPEIAYRKLYDDFITAYKSDAGKKVLAALRGVGDMDSEASGFGGCKTIVTGAEAYALGIVNEEHKDADKVSIDFGYAIPKVIIYKKSTETVQWNSRGVSFDRAGEYNKRDVHFSMYNLPSIVRNDGDRVTGGSAGYIAGDKIFIQARDINIDGIIQSGYGEYRLNLTAADEGVINSIKQRYRGGDLTDAQVLNNSAYCIREGGAAWDSASQSYRYEMAAYYNPATDTVVVPTVNSRGGDIYLNGRIVSTGNGEIKCLDGVSTININNTYNHNLSVSDLTVSEVQGRVTISDDGLMRNVSIYRNEVKSEKYEGTGSATGHVSGGNGSFSYQPKSGLSYEWLSGEQQNTIKTYEGKKRATWWGWSSYKDYDPQTVIDEAEDTHQVGSELPADLRPRTEGNYITEEATTQNEFLKITRTYTHVAGVKTLSGPPSPSTSGYLGCHKWLTFQWTEKNGYTYTYEARVKADYPIKIDFIGVTADNGMININNIGNVTQDKVVTINGNVGNTQLYDTGIEKGRVNIQSNGAIKQLNGSIYGQTVDLSAKGNIENIKITAGNIVNLDAWSTAAGSSVKVDVTAQGSALGNINLGAFGGGNNNVFVALADLTAQGNIQRATNAVNASHNNGISLVKADRIDLVSTNGGIGTVNSLFVNGGQIADTNNSMSASVNANAKNDIRLEQVDGTLRAGKIFSSDGSLFIHVPNGGIVDAQMAVATPESEITTKKDLISEWASIGVIDDGSKIAKEQIAMKNEQLKREREVLIIERDAEGTSAERKAQINKQLAEMPTEYTPWDADKLLYAMQASIFNPEAGVTASPKDPNLYGKNINLSVASNVGILSEDVKTISTVGLYDQNPDKSFKHLDDIRAISWADPGTVKYDKDKKEITIVNKIAIGVQHQTTGSLVVMDMSNNAVSGNVYIEGRDLHSTDVQNRNIDIFAIRAMGDVRLTSLGNLTTSSSDPAHGLDVMTHGDLFLSVGDAADNAGFSLGSEANPFFVQAAGNVQVLATGDIYLKSLGDLNVLDVVAGRKGNDNGGMIYLEAVKNNDIANSGNIYGVVVPNQDIQGSIRSDGNKSITLKAERNIGSWDDKSKTVRIKNADTVTADNKVNLSATSEIVVEGVSTAPVTGEQQAPQGVFSIQNEIIDLSEVGRKRISITVNGTLLMAGDLILNHNNPETVIALKADKLEFNDGLVHANTINLQSVTSLEQGAESAIVGINVNLVAGVELDKFTYGTTMLVDAKDLANARVAQKDEAILRAYNLNVTSNADIDLGSQENKIFNVSADAQKSIQIASGSLRGSTLGYDENAVITATVKNSHDADNKVHGDVIFMVYDTDTIKNNLYGKGDFLATGDIMFYDEAGNLDLHNDGGKIMADGMVVLMANTDLNAGKPIYAGKGLGIIAKGNVTSLPSFAWVDGDGFYVESLEGNINASLFNAMVGSKDAGGNITYVNGSIKMIAEKGSINNINSLAMYAHDDVELRAKTNITNDAGIYSENGNIEIYTLGEGTDEGEILNNNELITQNGYVLLYGNKGVTNKSSIVAASVAEGDSLYRDEAGYVTILSNTKIANTNDVDANREVIKADKGVYMFAGSEGLTNSADIEVTKGDVILYGVGEYRGKGMEYLDNTITGGNVINSGNIFTNEGNIDLNAGAGLNNTTIGSIHTKKGDITLYAGGDLANEKDIYTEQGNVDITAVGNLTSATGNLVALGNAETEGNLTLISEQGNITYAMHADGSGNGGVAINSEYFGLSTGKLTMMATEEAADKGKISINSSLYAGRGISIIADKEIDVSADHGIVAKDRDIEIISKNGHLHLLGDITAEGATEGNITLSGKGYVKSKGEITVNKGDFAATATAFAADDPATLTDDQKGYITIGKDAATDKLQVLNGKITMTAADKISLETAANAKTGFTATAGSDFTTTEMGEIGVYNGNILVEAGKNIDNAGKVYVTTGGNIIMEAKSGSFGNTNTGKITANQGYVILFANPNITNGGQISTVNGFINLSVMGGFANSGTINSATTGDIEITADNNINSATGTISAKTGNITVVSHNGAVSSKIISAETGNIGIKAGNGDVTNKEIISTKNGEITIDAIGKVDNTNSTISTTTTGDIIVNAVGILDSSNGTISTVSGKIDLTAGGNITSKIISTTNGGINVTSQGKITNSESISTAETGDVVLKATDDITSKAITTKNGRIEINGQKNIISSEKISSTEAGDIVLTAGKGIKDETGTISTKEGIINLTANNGDIVTTNVNTITGDISVITKGTVNGDVISNNSISTTNGNISIDAAGKVESINGTISTAETGDIKILATGILNSSNGTISTKTGKIDLIASGAITSKTIKTVTGDITVKGFDDVTSSTEISVAGTGEIYVTADKTLTNNGTISTGNGNICLAAETDIVSKDVKTDNGHIGLVTKNDLTISGDVLSTDGNVFLFAGNKILNSGVDKSIKAGQNIIMFIAENGLENRGKIEAGTLNGTTQGSVVMGDFSDFVVGGTVASESFISAETFALIDSLLGEYAIEIKGYESKGNFVNTGDITAHKGWVYFSTAGESMENSGVLLSQGGNIYLGCDGTITNSGIITAKDENVAIAANGIKNHANIEAQKSVFLLSTADIYNGEESGSPAPSTDIHIYAGDDILLLTKNGLDNKSGLIAGTDITDGSQGHGGDIFLDDYEFLRKTDKLDADTKGTLISLAGKYWSALVGYESNASIENEGDIIAYKGTEGNGLVHLDSQGNTENTGNIKSVDGMVFMDSTADLINSGHIYVTNTDTTDLVSCDVTLQATGNVYNAGNIYVEGKGVVLLDADSLNGVGTVATSTVATVVFKGIYNTGDIYAEKGDVSFKAANGDIYNADELTSASVTVANGNISMWAPKGSVNNTKSLSATQSISIEALTDIYNLPTSATGADNISVSRGLQTQNGDIILKSNNGNIWNGGTIIVEEEGNVKLTAKGNIVNTLNADAYVKKGNVTFKADSAILNAAGEVVTVNVNGEDIKGIYNTGDIYAVEGDVTFETINGDIYNADSLTTSDSVTCSNGSITMNAIKGEIVNTKALVATKDIWMGSWSDIYNLADSDTATDGTSVMRGLTAQNGNITLISYGATENGFEGLIVNKGTLTVTNGDLTVRAYGSKKITDVIPIPTFVWEEGTPMKDDPEINYSFLNDKEGNIQVTNGEVKISTIKSVITFGDMEAKKGVTDERENSGNIAFTSDKGNVIIYSVDGSYAHDPDEHEFKAERDMLLKASEGYVYSDKAFISEGDMVLEYGSGMQDLGEIKSNTGSVYITATGHNYADGLTINASVTAAKNIEIVVGNGQLTVSDSAGTAGTLHAGEDIVLTADDNVTIENAAKLVTDGGGLELTSNRGGIDVTGHVTAKDFVRIYTKGESTDERAGNYADRFAGDYSEPTAMTTPTFTGIKVDGNIVTDGDIDIATYGDDVTLKNVTAGKMAAVGTSDGKVKIEGTIKGQNVALYSEKATADIEFEKINVEEKLILAGNNWNLDMTNVDSGGNPFDLYVYGAIGADGTVNLSSSVKLDYRNGPTKDVRIRQLNAVNVEVHTDGALTIDNLSVANKAELYVMGTKANVYGIMQGFDPEADFIYYDPGQGQGVALDLSHVYFGYDLASRQKHIDALSADPTIFEKPAYNPDNCPICAEDILAAVGTGTTPALPAGNTVGQGGKRFEQTSASRQKYAGILLADNYGFKSYAQRFSAEDMMIHLEDIKAMGQYDNYFNIGLGFFDRFNIIDIPDVAVNSITLNNTFRDSGIIVVRDDKEEDKYEF